jgi:hypothetical protein
LNDEPWEMASTGRKLAGGMPLGEGYFGYLLFGLISA